MRRDQYAINKDKINAQKRAAYAAKKSPANMSRKQLEEQAVKIYVRQNAHLGAEEAERRARALMDGNTDAQLRKYIKKDVSMQRKQIYAHKPNVPREKFTKYALNPSADPNKAKEFNQALGYTRDNCDSLIDQIRTLFSINKCREKGHNEYGVLYEQIMEIDGANGKTANV